jgi:hypothetical protein
MRRRRVLPSGYPRMRVSAISAGRPGSRPRGPLVAAWPSSPGSGAGRSGWHAAVSARPSDADVDVREPMHRRLIDKNKLREALNAAARRVESDHW